MDIKRYENEEKLYKNFKEDRVKCYSICPGIAKESDDILSNLNYSFMCSVSIKKDIENFFGKSNYFVNGKEKRANFFAFNFNENIIACTSESVIGTSWYWITKEEGSRYGNPVLLSFDKEVKNFWPDFCNELKQLIDNNIDNKKVVNNKPKIR